MIKPGIITFISLRDFMCIPHVEVFPGSNFNMVLGVNGSGKSAIVAAIILGLGGNPKSIGRGATVSDYVRHGKNEASILLKLQGQNDNEEITIMRKIKISTSSSWFLNDESVSFNKIKEVISQFNIQVDNLCQFLPQDRVHEFAKLNKQQLLKQTQIALCRDDLLQMQEQLIEHRNKERELLELIGESGKQHAKLVEINSRLESRVGNMRQRRKCMQQLEDITRKKVWIEYLEKSSERQKIKRKRDAAEQEVKKNRLEMKPLQDVMDSENLKLRNAKLTIAKKVKELGDLRAQITSKQKNVQTKKETLDDIKNELQNSLRAVDDTQVEINNALSRLEALQGDKALIQQAAEKEANSKRELQNQYKALQNKQNDLQEKIAGIRRQRSNKLHERRACEHELHSHERIMDTRLRQLETMDPDAHKATLWLRNNKQLFRSEIYEPIMMEVNVIEQKFALYVENSIAFRDKMAFVCTHEDDVETLSQHLCTAQGLRVGIICQSKNAHKPASQVPIERLRRFGFNAYTDSLFTAPPPIMTYLCKEYNLHNIPVAFKDTKIDAMSVPVRTYFNENTRCDILTSHYTGQKSMRFSDVRSDGSMSFSFDHNKMETLRDQIIEFEKEDQHFSTHITSIETQINELNVNRAELETQLGKIASSDQKYKMLEERIKQFQSKVNRLKSQIDTQDRERMESEAREKSKRICAEIVAAVQSVNKLIEEFTSKTIAKNLEERSVIIYQMRNERIQQEFAGKLDAAREATATLERVRQDLAEITEDAKFLLAKGKQLSNGCTPEDEGFACYLEEYERLPDDATALEELKTTISTRMQCLASNIADEAELEEYDKRMRNIAKIAEKLEKIKIELTTISTTIDEGHAAWIEPLTELVHTINSNFSTAFESMGCAGQVTIYKAGDRDYEDYGISILVTFRNNSPLQELNDITQSGGERSVTTAVYMISLQDLTPVPFRCMDEINQGMDEDNERRILTLLMKVTSRSDTSQYFFVSPKLIERIPFNNSVTIHIVHSGYNVPTQDEWNQSHSNLEYSTWSKSIGKSK